MIPVLVHHSAACNDPDSTALCKMVWSIRRMVVSVPVAIER